jgi:hypothetical protein
MITICSISARVKEFVVIGLFNDEVTDEGFWTGIKGWLSRPVMFF